MIAWSWECTPVRCTRCRVAMPELSGMSRLRSGQSTLDAWVRPFRRTTLQLRLRTQESGAALSPGTVPSTIRTNSPLSPFLAFRTIVESVSCTESMSDWGTNPPATNPKLHKNSRLDLIARVPNATCLEGAKLWPGAPWRCQLDWASFQDIVETSDPEPTVSVGIEQQAMLAGRIGSAVLS